MEYELAKQLYQEMLDTHTEIVMKGKTMPYTSINGHMFSILDKEGHLGLRLSKEDRVQFMDDHDAELHGAYGRVMREYVRVPETVLTNTKLMGEYLKKSFAYVTSLEPKPTTKKK